MSLLGPSHDLRLARRAAAGEPAAWREIVDRFGPRIHALALHFSRDAERAQDLTQEIFLRLFQNLGSFRGDVPLLAWTLRLSRNLCIDDYRRRRLERTFRFLPLETVDTLRDGERPRRPGPAPRAARPGRGGAGASSIRRRPSSSRCAISKGSRTASSRPCSICRRARSSRASIAAGASCCTASSCARRDCGPAAQASAFFEVVPC